MNGRKKSNLIASGMLITLWAHCCFAQDQTVADASGSVMHETEPQGTPGAVQVLSDRVHQLSASLESLAAVHVYSFVSKRGQNVLLGTPAVDGFNSRWKVEYRNGEGEWTAKHHRGPQLFESLQPGTKIDVRVSAVPGAAFARADYKLVFGSAPRMNYDLHHEEGLLRVPYGLTDPPFLATQAIKQTLLDVRFTDSKGQPLEGGVAYFHLAFKNPKRDHHRLVTSDSAGKFQEMLEIGTCQDGKSAGYFVHRHHGRNTWATRYIDGEYYARNVLLEELANEPHQYKFGHICKRTLVNWSRN